jgi:hypothetical protein
MDPPVIIFDTSLVTITVSKHLDFPETEWKHSKNQFSPGHGFRNGFVDVQA